MFKCLPINALVFRYYSEHAIGWKHWSGCGGTHGGGIQTVWTFGSTRQPKSDTKHIAFTARFGFGLREPW